VAVTAQTKFELGKSEAVHHSAGFQEKIAAEEKGINPRASSAL